MDVLNWKMVQRIPSHHKTASGCIRIKIISIKTRKRKRMNEKKKIEIKINLNVSISNLDNLRIFKAKRSRQNKMCISDLTIIKENISLGMSFNKAISST